MTGDRLSSSANPYHGRTFARLTAIGGGLPTGVRKWYVRLRPTPQSVLASVRSCPETASLPIAAQIGKVTAQRIPHECLVTLEDPGANPAALDAHREPVRERVVHPDQHLLANQPVGQDALETACRGREILGEYRPRWAAPRRW